MLWLGRPMALLLPLPAQIRRCRSGEECRRILMKSFSLWHDKRFFMGMSFLLFLALALGGCSWIGGGSGGNATPTAVSTPGGGNNATTTATPVVRLGVQPCPDAVKDPAHWTSI